MLMNVSSRVIFKILLITSAFVGAIWFIYETRTVMVWLLTAFVLALALNPIVVAINKRLPKLRRGAAVGIVFVVMALLLGVFLYNLVPPLVNESGQLVKHLPQYTDQFLSSRTGKLLQHYHLVDRIRSSQSQVASLATHVGGSAVSIAGRVFSSFVAALSILVITIFMLMEGPRWSVTFFEAIPSKNKQRIRNIAHDMYKAVTGYMIGKLIMSLLAAVPTYILLLILGVPFALSLALIVGIFDLIPLVGATIGAVVVVLVSLFTSVTAAIVMVIFFLVFQNIENHITSPVIMRHSVQLSSLTVLIAALLGAEVGGILGALLGIPIAACLSILLRDRFGTKLPS